MKYNNNRNDVYGSVRRAVKKDAAYKQVGTLQAIRIGDVIVTGLGIELWDAETYIDRDLYEHAERFFAVCV